MLHGVRHLKAKTHHYSTMHQCWSHLQFGLVSYILNCSWLIIHWCPEMKLYYLYYSAYIEKKCAKLLINYLNCVTLALRWDKLKMTKHVRSDLKCLKWPVNFFLSVSPMKGTAYHTRQRMTVFILTRLEIQRYSHCVRNCILHTLSPITNKYVKTCFLLASLLSRGNSDLIRCGFNQSVLSTFFTLKRSTSELPLTIELGIHTEKWCIPLLTITGKFFVKVHVFKEPNLYSQV